MEIKRDKYLQDMIIREKNGFVKVITGIRRCGKSYLLNKLFYDHLINKGVPEDHIIRFAFDSVKNLELIGANYVKILKQKEKVRPNLFLKYIDEKITDKNQYYLLLDEIQYLDGFEFVLNDYLREENVDVYVTGSNSRFLSTEIITEFAGRGDNVHVHPISYSEFYEAYPGPKDEALEQYMIFGGLPAVALMADDEQKAKYLNTQMENVYLRDIVERNNLTKISELNELTDILASGISTMISTNKLANTFKTVKKSTLSAVTIEKYISYFEESFVLKTVKRYDIKGNRYVNSPYKIYFEDLGLRNARINFRQIEYAHLMENLIFNELKYRGYNVDVGIVKFYERTEERVENKMLEVDFVANLGSRRYYIQSAYDIPSDEKMKQETKSLLNIKDNFKKIIVVNRPIVTHSTNEGLVLMSLKTFLLNPNSLEL